MRWDETLRKLGLLAITVLLIPQGSCKKWYLEDYRMDIAGTYYGNRHSESWLMGYPTTRHDTMIYVVVELWGDSSVLVNGEELQMDTGGYFVTISQFPGWYVFDGRFDPNTDSLFLHSASGGLGGGSSTSFKGRKCPTNQNISIK